MRKSWRQRWHLPDKQISLNKMTTVNTGYVKYQAPLRWRKHGRLFTNARVNPSERNAAAAFCSSEVILPSPGGPTKTHTLTGGSVRPSPVTRVV